MSVSAATLTWTGGSTGNFADASWTDGASSGLTPQKGDNLVFSTAGTFTYNLDTSIQLASITFNASVTIVADASGTPVYVSNGGLVVSDVDGDARTVVIDAPMRFSNTQPDNTVVRVLRAQDTLDFVQGIGGDVRWLVSAANSKGTIKWRANPDRQFKASNGFTKISGGTNEVWGGAFDAVDLRLDAGNSANYLAIVRFMGGDYTAQYSAYRNNAGNLMPIFVANSVSRFEKVFKTSSTWGLNHQFENGASVTFEKGMIPYGDISSMQFRLDGNNTLSFNGPIQFADDKLVSPIAFINRSADDLCEIELNAPSNYISQATTGTENLSGFVFQGKIVIKTLVEDAFSTNCYPVSLWLQDRDGNGSVVDLCGHDQHIGSLMNVGWSKKDQSTFAQNGQFTGGKSGFKSDTPAVVHVFQDATVIPPFLDVTWGGRFWGAAGLEKSGRNPLTLSSESPTTGTLAVAEGTLKFSGNSGAWPNCSAVVVKGGTLVIDRASRVPATNEYHLAAAGKLQLGDGVTLRASKLMLTDSHGVTTKAAPGWYTAASAPDYITGSGSLKVLGGGLAIFIK